MTAILAYCLQEERNYSYKAGSLKVFSSCTNHARRDWFLYQLSTLCVRDGLDVQSV